MSTYTRLSLLSDTYFNEHKTVNSRILTDLTRPVTYPNSPLQLSIRELSKTKYIVCQITICTWYSTIILENNYNNCKFRYIRGVLIFAIFRESTASRMYKSADRFICNIKIYIYENPSSRIHKTAKYITEMVSAK